MTTHVKPCTRCNIVKSLSAFKPSKRYAGGLTSWCRDCSNAYVKSWQVNNPQKRNLSELRAGLKKRYGISVEQYEQMYLSHGGCCAICKTPLKSQIDVATRLERSEKNKSLSAHVDHSHATGEVRGLLCTRCNTGIGQFKESVELLESASIYLRSTAQKVKTPEADK